jgi:hypothetical protein
MNTEPWWTCDTCGAPLARVGKKQDPFLWPDHRKVCDKLAVGFIKQWSQKDLAEWRRSLL